MLALKIHVDPTGRALVLLGRCQTGCKCLYSSWSLATCPPPPPPPLNSCTAESISAEGSNGPGFVAHSQLIVDCRFQQNMLRPNDRSRAGLAIANLICWRQQPRTGRDICSKAVHNLSYSHRPSVQAVLDASLLANALHKQQVQFSRFRDSSATCTVMSQSSGQQGGPQTMHAAGTLCMSSLASWQPHPDMTNLTLNGLLGRGHLHPARFLCKLKAQEGTRDSKLHTASLDCLCDLASGCAKQMLHHLLY